MGGIIKDIGIPHCFVMRLDIKLYGKWLYSHRILLNRYALVCELVQNAEDNQHSHMTNNDVPISLSSAT